MKGRGGIKPLSSTLFRPFSSMCSRHSKWIITWTTVFFFFLSYLKQYDCVTPESCTFVSIKSDCCIYSTILHLNANVKNIKKKIKTAIFLIEEKMGVGNCILII